MNRYITCITLSYTEFCKYISVRYAILYLNPIDPQRKNYLSFDLHVTLSTELA